MRAAVYEEHGGPEVLRVTEIDDPQAGPGEVRLAVRASSLNHLDLWVRRGIGIETVMPHIGGSDIAGVVDQVGPGAEAIALGTRVVVDPSLGYDWYEGSDAGIGVPPARFRLIGEHTQGGFAEYAVVPAANLVGIPEGVHFETAAAAALCVVTAWRALITRGGLRAGESVLITGASGGVSTMAVQLAHLMGATVYAVTSGAQNVARVRELGADHVYDRLEMDFDQGVWRDTKRRGVDLVIDSVGEAMWGQCVRALAVGGRIVCYGVTSGRIVETDLRRLFWKQLSMMGSSMGTPAEFRKAMASVFEGKVTPVIHEVLPLDQVRRAHEMLEAGQVFGKIVVNP